MRRSIALLAIFACACAESSATKPAAPPSLTPVASVPAPDAPPHGPRRDVVEEDVFGIHLVDAYRWMEKHENATEVSQWLKAEGERTRRHFDAMPDRAKLRERVRDLGIAQAFAASVKPIGDLLFYFKTEKGADLRKLVVRSRDGRERVLVDTVSMHGADGKHVSIDDFKPSPDGKWVAYGLAEGGGEVANVHVLETKTGRVLPDVLPRMWGTYEVAWRADNASFYYAQMAPEDEVKGGDPQLNGRVRLHRLGEPPSQDVVVLGKGADAGPHFAPEEELEISTFVGSPWVIGAASVAGAERRIFAARAKDLAAGTNGKSPWTTITEYGDHIENFTVHGNDLYVVTTKGAPNRRVLRVSLEHPRVADAAVVVPESADVIQNGLDDEPSVVADATSLYVHSSHDGRSRLRRLSFAKGAIEDIPLPFDGWMGAMIADPHREGVTVELEGWTHETRHFAFDSKSRTFEDRGLTEPSGIDTTPFVTDEVEAKSADGTLVPLTILRRNDLPRDAARTTILDGYGGYGISHSPRFRPYRFAWLERGGVYAIAHVRGGGEKGDTWRRGGTGPNKPKGIQDFIACAEYLIREKYTSPSRLAATGASMGGVLIGRAITERPDLFAAANIYAGVVNAMRYLQGENGASHKVELGTPDSEAGARALHAMDAFYNVRTGVKYPAIMLGTGLNDGRVSPWMSAKFGAQLRAVNAPVWLRVESDEGHGIGSTRRQRFDLFADVYSFFLQQMGDAGFRDAQVAAPAAPPSSH